MADVTLESIAAQLQRLLDGQRRLVDEVADIKERLRNVEEALVSHHRDVVRVDHRLDLVEA